MSNIMNNLQMEKILKSYSQVIFIPHNGLWMAISYNFESKYYDTIEELYDGMRITLFDEVNRIEGI